jgi:hypothetical protein
MSQDGEVVNASQFVKSLPAKSRLFLQSASNVQVEGSGTGGQ